MSSLFSFSISNREIFKVTVFFSYKYIFFHSLLS
jgi:hypothetical protein